MITGPAEVKPQAFQAHLIPPTAQPLVGDSMKMDVRFASGDKLGLPLTVTRFQVPTPPLTV
jgi:hypothetical protein